jgi:mRNA-degrading endonuclease RelE of RelBE toxin-antitoxin system
MPQFTRRAKKDLEALPESMRNKVLATTDRLDSDPSMGWKLKGKLEGTRSVNVGRSHRILYSICESGVVVKTVRQRKDAYR